MSDQNSQFENGYDLGSPPASEPKMTPAEEIDTAVNDMEEKDETVASEGRSDTAEIGGDTPPANEPCVHSVRWEPTGEVTASRVEESASEAPSPKKRGGASWGLPLALVLCVVIAVASAFGGFAVAKIIDGGVSGTESSTETGASTPKETEDSTAHLSENPEELIDKSESNDSVYGSAGEDVFAVSGVVRKVQDAVVVIKAKVTSTTMFGQSTTQTSSGSGVVISEEGYVLTCHHVVDGASSVQVILNSGDTFDASLVGSDEASDLAVLKIDPKSTALVHVEQGCSEDLVIGEQVVAIGNPLGILGGTVTTGIVSATEREIQVGDGMTMTLIQTDAAINSGNSGGGLFNLDGQLIGIVNSKYSASGVEGLAFAIPIDSAYTVQLDLIEYGYVRGVVDHGLELLEVDESRLLYYQLHHGIEEVGVYVVDSEYSENLKNADLIRSINGKEIKTASDFDALLKETKVGDVLTFVVARRTNVGSFGEEKWEWKEETVELELHEFVPDRLKDALK